MGIASSRLFRNDSNSASRLYAAVGDSDVDPGAAAVTPAAATMGVQDYSPTPRVDTLSTVAPAVGTAGNDGVQPVGTVTRDGVVSGVSYIPSSAITGANTNSRTVSLVNKGSDGSGSTTIATLAEVSGVNASAFVGKAITLSGTAANLKVKAGDILEWVSTHVGTGITDPGGEVVVTIQPTFTD